MKPNRLLAVLCTAAFMGSLDLFIVNVGLTDIGADVGHTQLSDLSWILNAYAIVFAALLVPAGRLADRYGNKQAFMAGIGVFAAASLGCAVVSNLWVIVAFRCLQAAGAAALTPTSLGLILTAMPPELRPRSVRIWAVSGSLGAAVGPAVGGLLVQASWRWIFVINIPIGIAAIVGTALLAPDLKHLRDARLPDLLGGLFLMVASGALALGLVQGPDWGWTSGRTLGALAVTVVLGALFVRRSLGHDAPIVNLQLFRHPVFARATLAMLVVSIVFAANLLAGVLWLQRGWHWSPIETGLGIAPGPVMVSVTALGLRRYTASWPVGMVAALGTLLMGLGGVVIGASIGSTPHYASEFLPGWLVVGAGVGFTMPTLIGASTAVLSPSETSTGSAVVQMARQIGSVLGVAALVVVLGHDADFHGRLQIALFAGGGVAVVAALSALGVTPRKAAATPELVPA